MKAMARDLNVGTRYQVDNMMMMNSVDRKKEQKQSEWKCQHRQTASSFLGEGQLKSVDTNDNDDVLMQSSLDYDDNIGSIVEQYKPPLCSNVDEAMASLHSSLDGVIGIAETPSSYIPTLDYDWLLDGFSCWDSEAAVSQQLLESLYGLNLDTLEQLIDQKLTEQEQLDCEQSQNLDDDEFGDFQSADISQTAPSIPRRLSFDEEQTASSTMDQTNEMDKDGNHQLDFSPEKIESDEKEETDSDLLSDNSSLVINTNKGLPVSPPTNLNIASSPKEFPLSLRLIITDMSTIENRFVRRLQQKLVGVECEDEKMPDEFEAEWCLDKYGHDDDETADVLKSLPWKFVPYWKCRRLLQPEMEERYVPVMHEHLTTELSTLDSALSQVNAQLLRQIQPHQSELEEANEMIHKIHQDIALALMYVKRSRTSMKDILGDMKDGSGLKGSLALVEAWDLRDHYVALDSILSKVSHVFESEKVLLTQIEDFDPRRPSAMDDCRRIVVLIRELYCKVNDDSICKLVALNALRERTVSAVGLFRERIDVLLTQVVARSSFQCTFWKDAYETLLMARLDVEQNQISVDEHSNILQSLPSTWSQKVVQSLCHEVDRAFARALLDPSDFRESLYDKELMELSLELSNEGSDSSRLRTVTHNLVTIRFNFEAEENYLPWVYRKLCGLLTDVLHTLYKVLLWHKNQCESVDERSDTSHSTARTVALELNGSIMRDIKAGVSFLWRHCEGVLTRCLDEYLHLAAKIKLFHGEDDRTWARDLEGLHEVLQLTNQFLGIGRSLSQHFQLQGLEVTAFSIASQDETLLQQKLCDVFRRHLRSVHVEAMNTFGATLAKEDWKFVSLAAKNDSGSVDNPTKAVKKILVRELRFKSDAALKKFSPKFPFNPIKVIAETATFFSDYSSSRNPFLQDKGFFSENGSKPSRNVAVDCDEEGSSENEVAFSDVHKLLGHLLTITETDLRVRSCKSVLEVLTTWASRLLTVSRLLPLIAEDVSVVFAQLCDLYLTTVLRLCSRNSKNEKIILGVVSPNPIVTTSRESAPTRSGSMGKIDEPSLPAQLFGFRRRPSQPKRSVVKSIAMVSANTEADVCYPALDDMARVAKLRKFIVRGQGGLSNVVNFDMVDDWLPDVKLNASESIETCMKRVSVLLEKRVCAALSSVVVAILMDVVRAEVLSLSLSSAIFEAPRRAQTSDSNAVAAFCSYVDTLLCVIPKFVEVTIQVSCSHSIFARAIVSQIIAVGGGWEEAKLNEHPNDYVDDVCQRYSLIWANLQQSNSKLPIDVVRFVWENALQVGFLSLLEGFSRVTCCSTEGRSLMSMDLAAFVSGTEPWALWERLPNHEEFGPPPSVTIKRGATYVETYIKMFYFPLEDIKDWIAGNYTNYQQNHTVALISGVGQMQEDRQDIIRFVKDLYMNYSTNDETTLAPSLCRHATC